MSRFVLSTMYAQAERFADGAEFARFAADAGYDAIEISHSTPEEKIDAIRAADVLPIASVHQPAPLRTVAGRPNANLNLAAIDEQERALAVSHTLDSIAWPVKSARTRSSSTSATSAAHRRHGAETARPGASTLRANPTVRLPRVPCAPGWMMLPVSLQLPGSRLKSWSRWLPLSASSLALSRA